MAEKKATSMVITVDLDCEKCRKKIKKLLCKLPEIQNQVYDEKTNTVTITVFSYCPEKIKKKICCKGGETIKVIEIKPPQKPKQSESEKQKSPSKPPLEEGKQAPGTLQPPPARTCCRECSEGHGGGPCYQEFPCYRTAVPCYAYYGRLVCCNYVGACSYGYAGCHVGSCYCVIEDSSSSCSVM